MKTFLMLMILATMTMTGANARSLDPATFDKSAALLTWDFDQDSHLATREVLGGTLTVNAVKRTVRLLLNLENNCPPNAFCLAYIPVYTIELPIVKVDRDDCGVVTYTALKDMMPVDGSRQKMVIRDYSHSICEMVYLAHTTISYEQKFYDRLHGRLVVQESSLTADLLK